MKWLRGLGLAALLAGTPACVPLSEHRKLQKRFEEQETYVVAHKDQVRELERREQVMTLRSREQEKQLELLRARLEKSERLRQRLEERDTTVAVSAPKPEEQPPATFMGLEVNPETQGVVLESGVLFASGQAELKNEGKKLLDRLLAEFNKPEYAQRTIRIDGHTDDAPIQHSKDRNSSNWDLSAKRSLAVLHYLEEHGVDAQRLSFAGFGQYRPFDRGATPQAKARNRRVEIVVLQD